MAAGLSVVVVSAAGVVGANAFPDQQVAEVDLTTEADFLAVSPNGETVYVTSQGGGSGALSTVDTATNTVANVLSAPFAGSRPTGVAVSPDGSKVYVSRSVFNNNRFAIIDAGNYNYADYTVLPQDQPYEIAVTPNGQKAYVGYLSGNQVSVMNLASPANNPPTVTVGSESRYLAVSPDGSRVYVANNASDSVSVIRTSDDTVVDTVANVGDGPEGIRVTPDGSRVYVANSNDDTVSVIRTSDNTKTDTINMIAGSGPRRIAISPDGTEVSVASYNVTDKVQVIRTSDNTVVDPVAVTERLSIAYKPGAGSPAYVTSWGPNPGRLRVLEYGAPTPPTGVTGTPGDKKVMVSWKPPTLILGAPPITGYTVTAQPGGRTCTTTGATSCTVEGLTNGTPYTFTVNATSGSGTSIPSAPSAPVTPVAPPTPTPTPTPTPKPETQIVADTVKGPIPVGKPTVVVNARTDGSFRTVRAKCVLKGNTLNKRLSDRLCGLVEKESDKWAKVIAAPTCTKGLRIQVTLVAKKPGETRTTWRKTWQVKSKNPIHCKIRGTG